MNDKPDDYEVGHSKIFGKTRSGKTSLIAYETLKLSKEEVDRIKIIEDGEPIEIDFQESKDD